MENTCLLTVLPVIPKWKIYNSVSKKPIKYFTILKERREFQNLLENVSKNLKSSCSIIDKKVATSSDKNNLEIVFLNSKVKDLLSLNLIVSKKHVLKRRNNLLIFLKNNTNDLKYHIQDDNIFVKCDVGIQWYIFYNLFEFLLLRYSICNIGSIFYCRLFSGYILKQEIRFLHCDSIFAHSPSSLATLNLHKSNNDVYREKLNQTCKKLPKRALCYQNYFEDNSVATDSQELTFKIMSDSITNDICLDNNSISNGMPKQKILRTDCYCSEIQCKCHESKWKIHKNITKYNVNCYMDLLLKKGVTSTDELSIAQSESSFSSAFRNFSNQDFDSSLNNAVNNSVPPIELPKKNDLPLSESQNGENCSKDPNHQLVDSTKVNQVEIQQSALSESSLSSTFRDFDSLLNNPIDNAILPIELSKRNHLPLNESQNGEKSSEIPVDKLGKSTKDTVPMANTGRNKLEPKPESLLKAMNLLNENIDEKEIFSFLFEGFSDKKKCTSPATAFSMSQTEIQNGEKLSKNPADQLGHSTKNTVPTNTASSKIEPKPESVLNAINLLNENADEKENFSFLFEGFSDKKKCASSATAFNMFQTAAGNKINISDTALKAAEKMFNEVMQSEDDLAICDKSTNVFSGTKLRTKNNPPSSVPATSNFPETLEGDKHLNENIDGMLVDNFFDDVCFDEKDEGLTDASQSSVCTNKYEKLSSVGKVRKSLGGRRSLKPYSVPKS